ncbi:hypothetical protein D3C84_586610 [compost metagenome]
MRISKQRRQGDGSGALGQNTFIVQQRHNGPFNILLRNRDIQRNQRQNKVSQCNIIFTVLHSQAISDCRIDSFLQGVYRYVVQVPVEYLWMHGQYTCMRTSGFEYRTYPCQESATTERNNNVIELDNCLFQYLDSQAPLPLYYISIRKWRYKCTSLFLRLLPGDLGSLEQIFSRGLDVRPAINQPSQFQL